MKARFFLLPFIICPVLGGCLTNDYGGIEPYMASKGIHGVPVPGRFPHCYAYGCRALAEVSLSDTQWTKITGLFTPPLKTPEAERAALRTAIGLFEDFAGAATGTAEDKGDTFKTTGPLQLDCEDESINTTTYVRVMEGAGLLRFHTAAQPVIRGPAGGGFWLHETAVIQEIKSGHMYAVDSWWHDNGVPPYIVVLADWKAGWRPVTPPLPGRKPVRSEEKDSNA